MFYLSFEEFQHLLTKNREEEENLGEHLYHTTYSSEIDNPACKGSAGNVSVRASITLVKVQLTFSQDTTIEMKSFQPQIGFAYCLKGKLRGHRQNSVPKENTELQYELTSRKRFVYATGASHGWMQFEKGKPYKAVYLLFSEAEFKQLIGEQLQALPEEFKRAIDSNNGFYFRFLNLSSHAIALGESIFNNPYSGKSRQFYRETKVIELLAYQIDELTKPSWEVDSTGLKLKAKEESLVEQCHQVLLSSLENPPSLIELAKQTGLSDYRLKNGFRQKYRLTPYRFVAENRLVKAKELLTGRDLTVSEVAMAVGFNSLGSFSNSFYERFGIRPSELK